MARGVRVDELVRRLRLETSRSATAVANADEKAKLVELLRRTQDFYYEDYNWPFLDVIRPVSLVKNQRFYALPSDLLVEGVQQLWVKNGSVYDPIERGITFENYNQFDSIKGTAATGTVTVTGGTSDPGVDEITSITVNSVEVLTTAVDHTGDNTTTATAIAAQINTTVSSPEYTATSSGAVVTISSSVTAGAGANTFAVASTVGGTVTVTDVALAGGVDADQSSNPLSWEIMEDDETDAVAIEIWPVPFEADIIYITGKRVLKAFSADADVADLDDTLLVLTAAAELLAKSKSEDAKIKANAAQARYVRLRGRYQVGSRPIQLRGPAPGGTPHGVTVRVKR